MHKDCLTRFIFEDLPIRGLIVQLNDTWSELKQRKDYPDPVARLLGELAAANILLASSLKLEGSMTMQIQSDGPVNLMVMQCNHNHEIRGLAHHAEQVPDGNLASVFGTGQLAITVDNKQSADRYQGIVSLEGENFSEALENYLSQSEQLPTKLLLATDTNHATGILIQRLPGEELFDEDDWHRVVQLTETLKDKELFNLEPQTIIHRLFNEDNIRLLDSEPCRFYCTCSRERVSNMLISLGKKEIEDIIEEQGSIEIDCEFCNQHYHYDAIDAEALFASEIPHPTSSTRH